VLARVLAATTVVSVTARADPCATEVRDLHDVLVRDRDDADTWNLTWRVGLTAATLVNTAIALTPSLSRDTRIASGIGAVESALGAVGQWVMPLRIDVPVLTGDACADAKTLRLAAQRAGQQQRTDFWLGHAGAIVVNAVGSIVLAERTSWQDGAISFAIGYPIGLLHIYTMPRRSWHAMITPSGVAVAGSF
jgi:hypothetical protein